MPQDCAQVAQYCLRWQQAVSGGILHWYVRRLASDLRFWVHVHIRTKSLSENRSFDGEFPSELWQHVAPLLDRIREVGSKDVAPSQTSDGALIEGNAGTGNVLLECNTADLERSERAEAFYRLVDLLQPHVSYAASLGDAA